MKISTLSVLVLVTTVMCGRAFPMTAAVVASCPPGMEQRTETLPGLFTFHVICDHVLIEIPPSMLNRDMLLNTEFAALSTGSDYLAPGSVVDSRVVRWIRRGNKVYLENVRYEMWAENMPNLQRGVESASLRTVIRAFDVLSEGPGGAPIIDVTSIFVADVPGGFALEFMRHFKMRSVDPKRSYIETVKAFPGNIDIRFHQTWMADPAELRKAVEEGEEPRPASLGFVFHTSLLLLPEEPMRPRYWDERVGYYSVPFDDYGTNEHGKVRRAFIQRYRLEKKNPQDEVSEPVKPIVFYLSNEVPDKWRPYIKRGIEDWQQVFEKAGFRNAIVAQDAPTREENPNWDPEDVRYNVVRWTPSGRQNAMGPAVADPRSGEVISSHAIFWHDVLRLAETWYFTQVGALDPRARKLPLPDDIVGEMLRYIVTHEIGHALGLRHNFKAHSAYSVAQLRSREWTEKWGTSASIMDYARLNYVAQPGDGAYLMPKFGPYDSFAIEWGYRQFATNTVKDGKRVMSVLSGDTEWPYLDKLAARQVDDPMVRFGGEDSAATVDPTVNTNVLSGDPIEAAEMGLKNVDRIVPLLTPATTRLGGGYERLREMYEALIMQRHRELGAVVKLVGGIEETRYQAGRGSAPFKPVPTARQRAAVKFLLDRAFSEPVALLDRNVLTRITPAGGADVLQGSNIQLLKQLIDPAVFHRMSEAKSIAADGGGYDGMDILYDLNDGLFRELDMPVPVVSLYRREVQRNYVTILMVATGAASEPRSSTSIEHQKAPQPSALSADGMCLRNDSERALDSALSAVARQYRQDRGRPSEFRAALRAGVAHLYTKIEESLKRIKEPRTIAHLRDLRSELGRVP